MFTHERANAKKYYYSAYSLHQFDVRDVVNETTNYGRPVSFIDGKPPL